MTRTPRRVRPRLVLGLAAVTAVSAVVFLGGCTTLPSSQTSVVENRLPTGITPTQRGVVRREVLAVAKPGFDAFASSDAKAMEKYFKPYYVTYYKNLYEKYAKQGKKRVRKFEIKSMDVSDMNNTGTQALVDVSFVDHQYYADLNGKAITKPTNKSTFIQLTIKKQSGKWIIDNMIGEGATLN